MFVIIRSIIGCVFLICSILVIKTTATRKRTLYIIFTVLSVVLTVILSFFPLENLFITFNSSEAAYKYYSFGESNIELVVEGDSCDFIVDSDNNSNTHLIVPKTTDGWKIGIGSNTKRVVNKFSNGIKVSVYQYKNTDDYFIVILDTNGNASNIADNRNSKFYSLEKQNQTLGKNFITYYAHIPNFNSQYSLVVNDVIIY